MGCGESFEGVAVGADMYHQQNVKAFIGPYCNTGMNPPVVMLKPLRRTGRGRQDGRLLERPNHRLHGLEQRICGQSHLQDAGSSLAANHQLAGHVRLLTAAPLQLEASAFL